MPDLKRLKGVKDKVADTAASVADSAQDTLRKTSEKVTDTASSVAGAVQDASQEAAVKATDTASSVTGTLQDASSKASVKATDVAASVVWSAQDASEKVTDTAASAAGTVRETAQKAPDLTAATAEKVTSGAKTALQSTTGAVQNAAQEAPNVAMAAVEGMKTNPKAILEATTSAANALLSTTQGLLASNLAGAANDVVQELVKGAPTIYDKAMDANFIQTGIGGSWHRLFDGGHTIGGAWDAARGALPDDTIIQEARGTILGLLRDVSTPRGLPLATWDKETFDQINGALESKFHIPHDWFRDLNTYDVPDLIGSTIGAVALIFNWNRADTETFARFVGSMGVSSALSANPLLLVVTVVALARAFQKAHQTGEYAEFMDGQVRGGLVSGATLATVGLVGVTGGPAGMALLVALVTGILVNKATQNVSIIQIGQVVARQAAAAATEAKRMIAQQVPAIA